MRIVRYDNETEGNLLKMNQFNNKTYRPIMFIAITFAVTWILAIFSAYQVWFRYDTVLGTTILLLSNFLRSASPFLATLILTRSFIFKKNNFVCFFFGGKPCLRSYAVVTALFIFQFLTFYLFRLSNDPISIRTFLIALCGQILMGGGMEEGGWRGYLQPAFEQKMHITIAVILVGLIWGLWHIPYFFLPGSMHTDGNFVIYVVTTIATAYTLTAIYKLTGSIFLCILFHGWQNTIVMHIPTNMGSVGFLIMFLVQTVVSIVLCIKPWGRTHAFPQNQVSIDE